MLLHLKIYLITEHTGVYKLVSNNTSIEFYEYCYEWRDRISCNGTFRCREK